MEQENRNVVGKEEISKLLEEFYIEIRPHINGHKSAINKFFAALDSIKYPKHQPLSPQSDVGVEDAESVLRGHVGAYSIKPPEYYTKAIIAAMQEYASLVTDELEDKKWSAEILLDAAKSANAQLQSQLEAKIKECEELKKEIEAQDYWPKLTQTEKDLEYWKARCEAAEDWAEAQEEELFNSYEYKRKWQQLKLNKLNAVQGENKKD